jgi:hypothetical protein
MKNIGIYVLLFLFSFFGNAQVGIGTTTVKPSAILEMSNTTNQGFMPPVVEILNINDATSPILNPVEGMLVFNKGNINLVGFYKWSNGKWDLIGDDYNKVTNCVLTKSNDYNVLDGMADLAFKDFNDANFNVFYNNIPGSFFDIGSGELNLPYGAYSVVVEMNIFIPNEVNNSILGQIAHNHSYVGRLFNARTNLDLDTQKNVSSISSSRLKTHNISFSYAFKSVDSFSTMFSLAHDAISTYKNSLGGTSPNNGQIIIKNITIHVQRTVLID